MVRIACLNSAFSGIHELEASPVEGQSLQQKDKKGEKERRKRKPKSLGKTLAILIFTHAQAKMS